LPGIGHFAKTTIVPSSDIMVLEIYYCSLVTRTLNFGFCVLCFVFLLLYSCVCVSVRSSFVCFLRVFCERVRVL
jgi:hypothetical protein